LILAAEKVAPLDLKNIKHVTIEVYKRVKEFAEASEKSWNPGSREDADHSAPYLVAATLLDGTVTLRSFDDTHLRNPELRALLHKIEVVENKEFTDAYERLPQENHARVTVEMNSGERLVGKSGGDPDDIAVAKTVKQYEEKFRGLAEDVLGT